MDGRPKPASALDAGSHEVDAEPALQARFDSILWRLRAAHHSEVRALKERLRDTGHQSDADGMLSLVPMKSDIVHRPALAVVPPSEARTALTKGFSKSFAYTNNFGPERGTVEAKVELGKRLSLQAAPIPLQAVGDLRAAPIPSEAGSENGEGNLSPVSRRPTNGMEGVLRARRSEVEKIQFDSEQLENISNFSLNGFGDQADDEPIEKHIDSEGLDFMFELRGVWVAPKHINASQHFNQFGTIRQSLRILPQEVPAASTSSLQAFVLHPNSMRLTIWNTIGMIAMFYDAIAIPLLVFEDLEHWIMTFLSTAVSIYWTCDIPFCFFKGSYENGVVVVDPVRIAARYGRSWMFLDMSVVALDWVLMYSSQGNSVGGASRLGRSMRSFRLLRGVRLLRLLKMRKMSKPMNRTVSATFNFSGVYGSLLHIVVTILMSTHYIACGWYGVSLFQVDGNSWVKEQGMPDDFAEQYTTSYHWASGMYGTGTGYIAPTNLVERIYCIFVLFLAIIMFSSFVSVITDSMGRFRSLKTEQIKQFFLVKRFCRENAIPKDLVVRIQQYLQYAYFEKQRMLTIADIAIFKLLSEPLLEELRHQMYTPHLSVVPIFKRLRRKSPQLANRLCSKAVCPVSLATSDFLFSSGEVASKMYIVTGGELIYRRFMQENERVEETQWLSQAALWTDWTHAGDAQACLECEFLAIQADEFGDVVGTHPKTFFWVKEYAIEFVQEINKLDKDDLTDFYGLEDQARCQSVINNVGPQTWWQVLRSLFGMHHE